MVKQKKFEQTFINEYMAWNLHDSDVKKQGIAEGISQGAAQQKAEDDKVIAQITAQKDALLSSKDEEVARQAAEIERLKALLAQK